MRRLLNQVMEDKKDILITLIIGTLSSLIVWLSIMHDGMTLNAFGFIVLTASPLALGFTLLLLLAKDKKWDTVISLINLIFEIAKLFF